jgi:trehalose synthase
MTERVITDKRSLGDYTAVVGEECLEELRVLAEPFNRARVLHINATAAGGGVAEILKSFVPLMCDLGINAEWHVLRGADEFYEVTKTMHNGLQGMQVPLTPDMKKIWIEYNSLNADFLSTNGDYDFVVAHDPQAAGLLKLLRDSNGHRNIGPWIWRCHIDLTAPQPDFWEFLRPYVEVHDAAIFSKSQYFPKDLHGPLCFDIPPGIDPLNEKNHLLLEDEEVRSILMRYGVDPERPFIFKVSRFDPWKDFCGIIDVYELVRK